MKDHKTSLRNVAQPLLCPQAQVCVRYTGHAWKIRIYEAHPVNTRTRGFPQEHSTVFMINVIHTVCQGF